MSKNYFEDCKAAVKTMLYPDLQPGKTLPEGKLEEFLDMMLMARDEWRNNINRDAILRELKSEIDIGFSDNYIRAHGNEKERDHIDWLYEEKIKIDWKHWNRYKTYLQRKHPISTINNYDSVTDDILANLENPKRPGKWDTRGLVVGRVQSGKTSNYIGLVNKAFDAGYKRIIVLSGIEKDLRVQTQVRFEEGCLGLIHRKDADRKRTGIGNYINNIDELMDITCFTTRDSNGDIRRSDIDRWGQILRSDNKLLLVVKKNVSVLESLILWLNKIRDGEDHSVKYNFTSQAIKNNFPETVNGINKPVITGSPLLIIDDEADHASIDTKRLNWLNVSDELDSEYSSTEIPDPDHNPSRTNECVRRILNIFDKKAYIGYTATPFANIFISPERETNTEGLDLFPKDFVYSLPTPDNYFGIEQAFSDDKPNEALGIKCEFDDLIKNIDDHVDDPEDIKNERATTGWMPPLQRDKEYNPKYKKNTEIPPSLENAILSFLISSSVRKIRGQSDQHSTMMIHVTRFTKVQENIKTQVKNFVDIVKSAEFGNNNENIIKKLKYIWDYDYSKTLNTELNPNNNHIEFKEVIKNIYGEKGVLRNLEYVKLIGGVKDTLDYDAYKNVGKTVIVIGGVKLSRGLTLEGLCVSYFLRTAQTLLADTMTQMGRFFGYRKGYLDLCRMYIPELLKDRFTEFAKSISHLDSQFHEAIIDQLTPSQYKYVVQESPNFRITSKPKSQDTVMRKLHFSNMLCQSIHFFKDKDKIINNQKAVENLLASLDGKPSNGFNFSDNEFTAPKDRLLWEKVDSKKIIKFFTEYKTTSLARQNNAKSIREYISLCNKNKNQLTNWSVLLASGSHKTIQFNNPLLKKYSPKCAFRSIDAKQTKDHENIWSVGVISEPIDEVGDLNQSEWEITKEKHKRINDERAERKKRTSVQVYSGSAARYARGSGSENYRGLLIIYPIITGKDANSKIDRSASFGFAVSFPKTSYEGEWRRVQRDWFIDSGIDV